jgi:hypothetical protein
MGGQHLLKLVVPFVNVGDAVDERQKSCKATSASDASSAHNAAVGYAFPRGHGENGNIVAILVVSEQKRVGRELIRH